AKPNFAAGVALRALFRTSLTYQGAYAYKMQAGMGDVGFTPLYIVLQRRGVEVRVFHRLHQMEISGDGRSIGKIHIGIQATLKNKEAEYDPLVPVKGLDCWPSVPRYEQLNEGGDLQKLPERGCELESWWSPWKNPQALVLEAGKHFDLVILGIPVGALRYICGDLMDANLRWRDMVANVRTVQTQAFQLWMNQDADTLGWHGRETALLGAYLESSSDMSHLIPREDWPDDAQVRNIPYFCNAFKDDPNIPEPFTDPKFPRSQADLVKKESLD